MLLGEHLNEPPVFSSEQGELHRSISCSTKPLAFYDLAEGVRWSWGWSSADTACAWCVQGPGFDTPYYQKKRKVT